MKCVPVHHGIPAVLHRDEPWLHRHSENGALANEIAEPHLDMNIKVTAFTVSEKSSNIEILHEPQVCAIFNV